MFVNVGQRLSEQAARTPEAIAVVETLGRGPDGRFRYRQTTFRELDDDSSRIAAGLIAEGLPRGARTVLMVYPGIDFISLVFALFKAGAVAVLIDPGMGRGPLIRCLRDVQPEAWIGVPKAHAVRAMLRWLFPQPRCLVTVGTRLFWGGTTLDRLRRTRAVAGVPVAVAPNDPAAIIFTSGGTGPPKGVLYTHGNFDAQVDQIRQHYGIAPGEIDLPCFPLFGLFNCAMGVTAVIPLMDASRPAQADPQAIIQTANDWRVMQAFASPAVWRNVGAYAAKRGARIPSLRRVMSAGASVPIEVLEQMLACIAPEGEMFTPYGATEALPVASISAREVLGETAAETRAGGGVCVGRRFPGIRWKIIRIVDGPIATLDQAEELPQGEIGELIVAGPVVTSRYVTRAEANAWAKIADGNRLWHRMGDVGYLDKHDRFWICGRLVHRVETPQGTLYPEPCEAVFNAHPWVARSALVGIGQRPNQTPVIVVELNSEHSPLSLADCRRLFDELAAEASRHPHTAAIRHFLIHPKFPVDVRHNAKIARDQLARWAAGKIRLKLR